MAAIDESTVYRRRTIHLVPLSSRVPSSTDRHFEQYLLDHHHLPKLPSITKQPINRQSIEKKELFTYQKTIPTEVEHSTGSINRLLTSESYRRSQARLIEYRQRSKIPGIALKPTNHIKEIPTNGRNDLVLPLKEVFLEPTRTKQHQTIEEIDFVDDVSIFSNETDRCRRAKHWIKEHQFFFTEYQ